MRYYFGIISILVITICQFDYVLTTALANSIPETLTHANYHEIYPP
jgi:hypothetical protein